MPEKPPQPPKALKNGDIAWLDPATTPPYWQDLIGHAGVVIEVQVQGHIQQNKSNAHSHQWVNGKQPNGLVTLHFQLEEGNRKVVWKDAELLRNPPPHGAP